MRAETRGKHFKIVDDFLSGTPKAQETKARSPLTL
jgi:hypothetical protein